jgi:ABC-type glutathione transport system ATPase component
MSDKSLVVIEELCCTFRVRSGMQRTKVIAAVDHVDLEVESGEILGVVGESGSGKSTLARTLVRLVTPESGRILFDGADIATLKGGALTAFHADAQMIFQNPYQSLNPKMTVQAALGEVLAVWGKTRRGVADQTVAGLLDSVHLPAHYGRKYPHELSGGERQRVAIARAIAVRPRLLIADEAVSALDVGAAARILNVLLELRESLGVTCMFITHDIGLARLISDRVAVMYVGSIVDLQPPEAMFAHPGHEYTQALINAQLHVAPADSVPAAGATTATM